MVRRLAERGDPAKNASGVVSCREDDVLNITVSTWCEPAKRGQCAPGFTVSVRAK